MTNHKFICYGLLDKNGELLIHDDAFTNMLVIAEATAETLNSTANLRDDNRTPYKPVALYYEADPKEQP